MDFVEQLERYPYATYEESLSIYRDDGILSLCSEDIAKRVGEGLEKFISENPMKLSPVPVRAYCDCDEGGFYAFTVAPSETSKTQLNQVMVYLFKEDTKIDVFLGSHVGELIGNLSTNGLIEIPYSFLRKKNLPSRRIDIGDGFALIVHPRLGIRVRGGVALGYGFYMKDINKVE